MIKSSNELSTDFDFSDHFVLQDDDQQDESRTDHTDTDTYSSDSNDKLNKGLNCTLGEELKVSVKSHHPPSPIISSNGSNQKNNKTSKESVSKHSSDSTHCFSSHHDWTKLYLSRPLLKACAELCFKRPTIIQEKVIPLALQGRDVLATAQTGSGKTAAFLLPILERLCQSQAVRQRRITYKGIVGGAYATKALVLLPTRELAVQCYEMLEAFSRFTPVTQILVSGGLCQKTQEASFRRQPDIVVATPGRVLDILLNVSCIHLELLEIVVLDEADRLLEMGFKQECLEILSLCSKGRQTLLFSATLSEVINDLASLCLKNPVHILVSKSHSLPKTLLQIVASVPKITQRSEGLIREAVLLHLCLEIYPKEKIIAFFQTKKSVHRTSLLFRLLEIPHAELHGNLPQSKRLQQLESFQSDGSVRFLLCSELAARGLDISNTDLVVNYVVPPSMSRYVHQVGRVARMGQKGTAITLFSSEEKLLLKRLLRQSVKDGLTPPMKLHFDSFQLEPWIQKIQGLQGEIETILKQELFEKELRLAEMEAQKGINIQLFQNEILSRPKKRWVSKAQLKAISKHTKPLPRENSHEHVSYSEVLDETNTLEETRTGKTSCSRLKRKPSKVISNSSHHGESENDGPFNCEKKQSKRVSCGTHMYSETEKKALMKQRLAKYENARKASREITFKKNFPSKAIGSKVKKARRLKSSRKWN